MILKLVVDRKCLSVLDISVEFTITPVREIMCEYWVCYISIGEMGLIMIISGSIASVFAGCILDAVKKYKVSVI